MIYQSTALKIILSILLMIILVGAVFLVLYLIYLFTNYLLKRRYKKENDIGRRIEEWPDSKREDSGESREAGTTPEQQSRGFSNKAEVCRADPPDVQRNYIPSITYPIFKPDKRDIIRDSPRDEKENEIKRWARQVGL